MRHRQMPRTFYLILLMAFTAMACQKPEDSTDLKVHRGSFEATLKETGELQAVNARSIMMPSIGDKYGWQFKITGIVEHGAIVSAGDSVAQIDPSSIMKYLLEQTTRLETEQAILNKLLVERDNKAGELQARLREARADYDLKKLELEKFEFESERNKEIKSLEFDQATIRLNQVEQAMQLEQKISENSLIIQRIKVRQIENNIVQANEAITRLTIRSPIDGIFQKAKSWRTRQLYQVGDEIFLFAQLAIVPDLNKIKVKSTIHENDIGKVKIGQKVNARLEAYPARIFTGTVTDIGKLSYKKERNSSIKIFDIEIVLDKYGQILKPGMTVSCEIFYEELEDVLYVDNSCLMHVDGVSFIYLEEKGEGVEFRVETGPSNNHYTVIYGDFKQGAKLMLPEGRVLADNRL